VGDVDVLWVEVGEERSEAFGGSFEWSWRFMAGGGGRFRVRGCCVKDSRLCLSFRRHFALLFNVMLIEVERLTRSLLLRLVRSRLP